MTRHIAGRSSRTAATASFALLFATGLGAQDLDTLCPNAENTAVLLGVVSDLDAQMALPGATVRATWEEDGLGETETAIDGSFTMCYLPLGTELSVQAMFATIEGQPVSLTLSEPITHQDIEFSLSGAGSSADVDQMWACIGAPGSQLRIQLGNLVRCDPQWPPLDRCPKQDLQRLSVSASSARRGVMKEMIDELIDDAKRLGANALVNVEGGRDAMSALAVKIDVDPSTC